MQEFQQALQKLIDLGGMEHPSEELLRESFKQLDSDCSGTLDVKEFKTLVRDVMLGWLNS